MIRYDNIYLWGTIEAFKRISKKNISYASEIKSDCEKQTEGKMKNNTIKERKEELKNNLNNTYCDNICNYSEGYICDIITEIANNNVDIYYNDLFEWCKGNFSYVNDWIEECGSSNDIIKDIQGGQYKQISEEIYENLEDMMLLFAYDYMFNNDITLSDEQLEELESDISIMDHNNTLDEIIDAINERLESEDQQ